MKKSGLLAKIFLSGIISFSFFAVVTATVSWFINKGLDSKKEADGVVGLRSYFYSGDGLTEQTAFEITTPTHMYNLSMLQNIGLFPEKRYFRIGHKFTEPSVDYRVIVGYDENNEPIWGDELDMSTTTIAPIGNEATPFMGDFDGHGIPVSNIHVQGNPEDIGFFGYIGYDGDVQGLVLNNPTIESLGYNNNSSDNSYKLFNPEIEDLYYQSNLYFQKFTKVKFYGYDNAHSTRDSGTLLTNENGLGGSTYGNINANGSNLLVVNKGTVEEPKNNYIYNGYFDIKFPQDFLDQPGVVMTQEERDHIENDPFTYHWVASTTLISSETCIDIDGDTKNDTLPMINLTKLINSGDDDNEFNKADTNSVVKTRLYLYATIDYKNYEYSRVIQTYEIEFNSNLDKQNTGYSMAMFCDYVAAEDADHTVTNYHHGNNIGFLAGHLDGNMQNCYVYGLDDSNTNHGAHLIFNNTNGMCPVSTTSDIGLIGEVGEGVYNTLDPDIGVMVGGDIGVMNFTKIYEGIRKDFTAGDMTKAGRIPSPTANYISYSGDDQEGHSIINTSSNSLFENYKDYLRYAVINGTKHYFSGVNYSIPSASSIGQALEPNDSDTTWHNYPIPSDKLGTNPEINSVDFICNQVIQDEDGKNRGLGVFKIATVYNGSNNPGFEMYNSIGKTAIVNGTGHSKVYFSTAEYDHSLNQNTGVPWSTEYPVRPSTLPSYSDTGSFDYNFQRDFNYCFELDLTQISATNGYNYMSNTDSPWLANYLKSKLIDKKGEPLKPGSKRFGFMFRSSDSVELTELSSYMAVGYPKKANKSSYGDGKYYPSNSIVFKIDNDNGANVSVVARRDDVTVYQHHSNLSSKDDIVPLYTMRAKNANTDATKDAHRYFKFDVEKVVEENGEPTVKKGVTGTEIVPYEINGDMNDDNNLYAHIFKLPKGEYVLGAADNGTSDHNNTADIYYLAVQGQDNGDLGSDEISEVGNVLRDVDFLTEQPTKVNFPSSLAKADFQFFAEFNTTHGDFVVNTTNNVGSTNYVSLEFEGPDDPLFVSKLSLISFSNNPRYYVRGTELNRTFYPYRT